MSQPNASEFCRYHPLAPSTYACSHCETVCCDDCIDEGEQGLDARCFTCQRELESLGAVNHAVPFWHRLEESFRYPMNANAGMLIIGVAVLSTLANYIMFGLVLALVLSGAFIKYCFSALKTTASGVLIPPDIVEAYGGGLTILGRLLIIIAAVVCANVAIYRFLGPEFSGLFAFLSVLALPAVIIIFAMSDSIGEAISPLSVLQLITSIGLPYGLLLGFIMVMSASVSVINALFMGHVSFWSTIVQSAVSNYYTLVIFHIMGYMIFQYQGVLGFVARIDDGEAKAVRPVRDRLMVKISIQLKEGDYNGAVNSLQGAIKKYPQDRDFQKQYFEFIYATKRLQVLNTTANDYLKFLIESQQEYQLLIIYKRMLHVITDFMPDSAQVRHKLANACQNSGDPLTAVKLLNGMQKTFPEYSQLPEALLLMADALEELPNKQPQATQFRALAKRLSDRRQTAKPRVNAKAAPIEQQRRAVFGIDRSPAPTGVKPGTNTTVNMQDEPTDEAASGEPGVKELAPIEFK